MTLYISSKINSNVLKNTHIQNLKTNPAKLESLNKKFPYVGNLTEMKESLFHPQINIPKVS